MGWRGLLIRRQVSVAAVSADLVNVADSERGARRSSRRGRCGYFAGGAGDELTLRENVAAWGRWRLRPRVLADVGEVTTATELLGRPLSMPLLVAPVAYQRLARPRGRGGDGAGGRRGRDGDVPLDPGDDPAERGRGSGARGAPLVPALPLQATRRSPGR